MIRSSAFVFGRSLLSKAGRRVQNRGFSALETDEWVVYPRETEGNIYKVNWSLCEDGVVPVGKAYRNARISLLTNALGSKSKSEPINTTKLSYFGKYELKEAGDNLDHEEFTASFASMQDALSSGQDLFVEDGLIGSFSKTRNGVRVVTDNAAVALAARALMIPSPLRPVDHRARFAGWNKDPRWASSSFTWNGKDQYEDPNPDEVLPGERPVVAFVGGSSDTVAVQFIENNEVIVGANVLVGGAAPIRALIEAIGHANTVLVNQQQSQALALPGTLVVKGDQSALIIGADDEVIAEAAKAGILYGAYHSVITPAGASAFWNGYIGPATTKVHPNAFFNAPLITSQDNAAIPLEPNNVIFAPKKVFFYEKGAGKKSVPTNEALEKIIAITEESKTDFAKELLTNVGAFTLGRPSDVSSVF